MSLFRLISGIALAATLLPIAALATEYEIDPGHSSVNFKVRHLVSKTAGKFDKFSGKINHEPGKPDTWKVEAHIDAMSINTNEPKRDKHLRSVDFFDTDKNKEIVFKSTGVKDANDKTAKLEGNLTIHGVTKPVVLDLEMGGEGTDPWGNHSIGFTAMTKLNRKDFGLT
ncbi:MAG: polyisoprenoid-binding protein, partial [Deltaproteobacteria bacterium]|nr:polyisoprenoid-binding protein [Deltaproteobacteria bacterium]